MTEAPRLYHENFKTKAIEKEAVLASMDDEAVYGAVNCCL
jgi:predicted helicase